jgi:hypothetical protein
MERRNFMKQGVLFGMAPISGYSSKDENKVPEEAIIK